MRRKVDMKKKKGKLWLIHNRSVGVKNVLVHHQMVHSGPCSVLEQINHSAHSIISPGSLATHHRPCARGRRNKYEMESWVNETSQWSGTTVQVSLPALENALGLFGDERQREKGRQTGRETR